MKTIIAGCRHINDYEFLLQSILDSNFIISEVVSGKANGIDKLGEQFAHDLNIPVKYFPADWNTHGKSAGYIRNTEMAKYADQLIAIWDNISPGTKHMINIAKQYNLNTYMSIYK